VRASAIQREGGVILGGSGSGGIGRRASLRSWWPKGRRGSSPFFRIRYGKISGFAVVPFHTSNTFPKHSSIGRILIMCCFDQIPKFAAITMFGKTAGEDVSVRTQGWGRISSPPRRLANSFLTGPGPPALDARAAKQGRNRRSDRKRAIHVDPLKPRLCQRCIGRTRLGPNQSCAIVNGGARNAFEVHPSAQVPGVPLWRRFTRSATSVSSGFEVCSCSTRDA
jgi:hypothetical protein